MASHSRRYLPLFFGFLVLALWGAGCFERATGKGIRNETPPSQQAIIAMVTQSLTISGIPEPPLSRSSTRAERGDYLAATEQALAQLGGIGRARDEDLPPLPQLSLDDRSSQVLSISKMLAVQLADAIDRADSARALRTLELADDFANAISMRSVPDWSASATVADTLALGVKSVALQLDDELGDLMIITIEKIESTSPNHEAVLIDDSKRIAAWFAAAEKTSEPVVAQSVMHMVGWGSESRAPAAADFTRAVSVLAPSGAIPPDVFIAECKLAIEQVTTYLGEPRGPIPSVDATRHPVAALLLNVLSPTYSPANQLRDLRSENWRMLALTIRLVTAGVPQTLDSAGDLAISPVSQLPFEYVRRQNDFDLVRPRAKARS